MIKTAHIRLLLSLGLMLAVFTGCGSEPEAPTEPQIIDNEQIVTTTPIQTAYLFCSNQGHTVQIQYDEDSLRGNVYCVFDSGYDCLAKSFLQGICTPELAAEAADDDDVIAFGDLTPETRPRYCEPIAEPVCGTNGRTYTNECVADLAGVDIIHDGACDAPQPTITAGDEPTGEIKQEGGTIKQAAQNTTNRVVNTVERVTTPVTERIQDGTAEPDWVDGLITMLTEDESVEETSLARCRYNQKNYYYQTGDFAVLYQSSGRVSCYPQNDINGLCPEWFTKGEGQCSDIWKK